MWGAIPPLSLMSSWHGTGLSTGMLPLPFEMQYLCNCLGYNEGTDGYFSEIYNKRKFLCILTE
jgi:hypothetical protein